MSSPYAESAYMKASLIESAGRISILSCEQMTLRSCERDELSSDLMDQADSKVNKNTLCVDVLLKF